LNTTLLVVVHQFLAEIAANGSQARSLWLQAGAFNIQAKFLSVKTGVY